jgi:hypothetical protein
MEAKTVWPFLASVWAVSLPNPLLVPVMRVFMTFSFKNSGREADAGVRAEPGGWEAWRRC